MKFIEDNTFLKVFFKVFFLKNDRHQGIYFAEVHMEKDKQTPCLLQKIGQHSSIFNKWENWVEYYIFSAESNLLLVDMLKSV